MKPVFVAGAILALSGCAPHAPVEGASIAAGYKDYGTVDDRERWAPADCEDVTVVPPRLSASRDAETHGRKLYYLFAKDRLAYLQGAHRDQPVGQVIVKEAWHPQRCSTSALPQVGSFSGLFIMAKTGDPDGDEGWIYATVAADGKTVTSSGKIASCMECHQNRRDRVFGLTSCAAAR